MKINTKGILLILISLFDILIFPGCQKVVNVDLNDAAPRIVIEGVIRDQRGPYTVTISKSGSYFNQPVLEKVSGAQVVITDNDGISDTLLEEKSGLYITKLTKGIPGKSYTLDVISGGEEYTGSTEMLSHVNIDSLTLVKDQFYGFRPGGGDKNDLHLEIHCYFRDPVEKNFYRVRVFKNDSTNTGSYRLFDDQYTNGEETELRVANATAGDTFSVELLSLDSKTYEYYRTLADLLYTNPFFGSTPANPNNNLSNGALGYFGAYAVSFKTIIITDSLINSVPR